MPGLNIFATGVISTPEIAQFQLGGLAFKVHTLHCMYFPAFVKLLYLPSDNSSDIS